MANDTREMRSADEILFRLTMLLLRDALVFSVVDVMKTGKPVYVLQGRDLSFKCHGRDVCDLLRRYENGERGL